MRIHIASDHAGYELKSAVIEHLREQGHDVIDHGAHAYDPNDVTLRLRAQYQLRGGTYLFGEWNDVNDSRHRAFYTGVRQEF